MGYFSIWHWIIMLLPIALVAWLFFGSKKSPPASTPAGEPSGVGGWLLLLIAGLVVIGPLYGLGQMSVNFIQAEEKFPKLLEIGAWRTYKACSWGAFIVSAILGMYVGFCLTRYRNRSVVERAQAILWIIGPGQTALVGVILPILLFGQLRPNPEALGGLLASLITCGIWVAYLSKSKRVKNTYGAPEKESQSPEP